MVILPSKNIKLGIIPKQVHSDNPKDYDEHGCLKWLNEVSQKHNQALHDEISRLRYFNPGVKIIYADYYGAAMEFIKNPGRFGEL